MTNSNRYLLSPTPLILYLLYQVKLITPEIDKKQIAHMIIGPDAPLNLTPNPSNSMGPVVNLRSITKHNAAIAASGKQIVAAKCSLIVEIIQLFSVLCQR